MKRLSVLVAGVLVLSASWARAQGGDMEARLKALEERQRALEQENWVLKGEIEKLKAPAAAAKKDPGMTGYWKDALRLKSDDGAHDVALRARAMFHNRTFTTENRNNDTFYWKEIGLQASGTIYKDYEYDVFGIFDAESARLNDGYLGWKKYPWLTLRVGQFKPSISEETLRSAPNADFAENSPMSRLVPSRDLGIQLGGEYWDKRIEYQVGVFNGTGLANRDDNDSKDVVWRLVLKPFATSDDKWTKGIRLGGAMTYGEQKRTFGNLSDPASGTTFLTMQSNVRNRQERLRWNVEGAWLAGPFKLAGEATWMDLVLARGAALGTTGTAVEEDIAFGSYYVEGLWVATGEDATLGRRKPAKNLLSDDGGIGLVEVAFRFSQFWVDDEIFASGFARGDRSTDGYDQYMIGGNWWFNPNTRFTVDFFYNDWWNPISINSQFEKDEAGFLTRFQIDF